jgi:hypothetical protein
MRRVLVVTGLLALMLFGGLGAISHKTLFWEVAVGLAIVSWLGALGSTLSHRRAVKALAKERGLASERHMAALAAHSSAVETWRRAEAERVAAAPHWLRVSSAESALRLDVFGGTPAGRRGMLAGVGGSLLEQHAVIVLDLSAERVCEGLIDAGRHAGLPCHDYQLPRDLPMTPLLSGLTGEQLASQIVEVLHADDPQATAAGRATDLMVLRKVCRAVGDQAAGDLDAGDRAAGDPAGGRTLTMARIHDALTGLLAGTPEDPLRAQFPGEFRKEVAGSLIRLAAVIEPLRDLGSEAAPLPPARLTCLSVEEGPRDVTDDLAAALVVQWATQAIAASARSGPAGGPRPAVIVAGADEQAARHLRRLTSVCERYDVPLIRTFSRLSEESARHLDTRNTAFMKLATRAEAVRAAEHIGMERRFVAGRFTHSRISSQSRTSTRGESVTHTTGQAQGEAVTKSSGSTTGESLAQTVVQRHNDRARDSHGNRDNSKMRGGGDRNVSGDPRPASGASQRSGRAGLDDMSSDKDLHNRVDGSRNGRTGGRSVPNNGRPGGGGKAGDGGKPGRHQPFVFDFITSRTKYNFQHQSEAKTESWTRTEETSHTQTRSVSKTEGTSQGEEITYELTYDHKVAPETLMSLPEDQMLAPHVVEGHGLEGHGIEAHGVEGRAVGGRADDGVTGSIGAQGASAERGPVEGKMIALVVNPEVIGSAPVAHVQPHEIPAFQPPPPVVAVREGVPEQLRALRPGN